MNKALAQLYLKQYDEAVLTYTRVIGLQPGNSEAYSRRGVAEQYLGKMTDACSDWARAVELGSEKANSYISKFCKH
jgi:Flp pilus assembly protein TadD